jgi:endonuclease YncB( thermonuclease family)
LVAIAAADAAPFQARVVGVSDGDSVTVLRDDRTQVRIRLFGIDAPEAAQPFGSRAKQLASDLAYRQVVRVEPRTVDRFGRTVANVILPDGRNLNHELVASGWAWWYVKYAPTDQDLALHDQEARRRAPLTSGRWCPQGGKTPRGCRGRGGIGD